MNSKYFLWALVPAILSGCGKELQKAPVEETPIDFVDPFIGTGGHGHTYPGASVHFGMIQLSPDNGVSGWDWVSGYHYSDTTIAGFSHLHLSGTGIGDLADLLFMPSNKEIDLVNRERGGDRAGKAYASSFEHSSEVAVPGFYKVFLKDPEVEVSLTATQRTGYQKYVYAEGDEQSVILDLGFAINWDKPTESGITVEDDNTITGYRHSTGWANNQKVFFVAEFSRPLKDYQLVADGEGVEGTQASGTSSAAQFFFGNEDRELQVKLALSSVSVENAKANLDTEENFEKVKKSASEAWEKALQDIQITTPVDSLKTIFYTALYHTKLSPVTFSDENGEFRKENDSIVTAEDYTVYSTLSLWDTFRAQQPLLTLTDPKLVSDIINSMLAYYTTEHILPVWTLYGNETNTMTGYHSIPVIAEAYFKGIEGFDPEVAYQAMKTTMMQQERGLEYYKEYGYIPYELLDESVTISLEYAYNDWCVAQMAKALGHEEDYQYFLNRSRAYQKLFDPDTGFMRGLSKDGESWNEPFDPRHSNHRENTDYTEGNAWQHSWFVLHEPEKFIELHGGPEEFTQMLEQLFTTSSEITGDNVSADISGLIGQYAHGNEPSHHIAYLFNKAGQPWRTQYWVNQILKTQYKDDPNGLSGNEDAGQMSAWYVFSSMGLYPFNPVSATYEIGSPLFESSVLNLENGNHFEIIAEGVSEENIYIQSATLNGEEFNRTSISHEEILEGGQLHFIMGPEPNKSWGVTQYSGN